MAAATSGQALKSSSSGLVFSLHPLVLINISDHWTRIRANVDAAHSSTRVYGCLLGQQNGREVSISNSFELIVLDGMEGPMIDEAFLSKKQEQYKQTFADLDLVGWYSTGSQAETTDMLLHQQIMNLNESPVFLLMGTENNPCLKDLPVSLFESELHSVDGTQQPTFVKADFTIQTSEAERIGVNQVAKVLPSGNDSGFDQLSAHYSNLHSAIKMLHGRVGGLLTVLAQMGEGKIPMDYGLLRDASSLLRRLPAMNSSGFNEEYLTEFNDALLTVLMSSMTRSSNLLLDIIDKGNVAYTRS